MRGEQWKTDVEDAVSNKDWAGLVQLARQDSTKIVRYLTSRLCSGDEGLKWKAVRALGVVAADREAMGEDRIRELLRRFVWLLSDESGNVPFGVPEAFGEVLVARPEFQEEFLPLLCSLAYDPERHQTGLIEQGVIWALGRVGPPAAACSPEAVEAVVRAAAQHPDPQTQNIAAWALSRF
jgi:hypothetical protein